MCVCVCVRKRPCGAMGDAPSVQQFVEWTLGDIAAACSWLRCRSVAARPPPTRRAARRSARRQLRSRFAPVSRAAVPVHRAADGAPR